MEKYNPEANNIKAKWDREQYGLPADTSDEDFEAHKAKHKAKWDREQYGLPADTSDEDFEAVKIARKNSK